MITITGTKKEVNDLMKALYASEVCYKSSSMCELISINTNCRECLNAVIRKEYTDDNNNRH